MNFEDLQHCCGVAVELNFIVPRRVAEKTPKSGSAPGSRGGGGRPSTGAFVPWTPFQQRQVCYDKYVILPRMCTYAVQLIAIWLPLLGKQIRAFSSLFQIKYRMYLGSQTVYTRAQSTWLPRYIIQGRPGLVVTRGKLSQWLYWEKNSL